MNRFATVMMLAFLVMPCASWAALPASGNIQFVAGNNVWQPGQRYQNGSDWLALACTATACRLEPATLTVRAEPWQGHYDEQATAGQKVLFNKTSAAPGKVIAWLRAQAAHKWLAPGPVTTYASNTAPLKRPASEGTLEVAVDLPDGTQASFVPLLHLEKKAFFLQLRTPRQRQLLGGLGSCSHEVSTGYFLWAGDLDRDGKPDYLISFVDADGEVILYLSSIANPAEMVGRAGIYNAPPFGGECDGSGWIGGN